MNGPLRKGWCPGALRPMQARDGLLVRLRITGGIVPAATLRAIAHLGSTYGNGAFDLSTRANLQMRGVTEHTLFPLQNALRDLGLIDEDIGAESVRNVISSPMAGLHAGLDISLLVAALEARLAETEALHALPGKFGFLIDDGGAPSLASVAADVRFDWDETSATFIIGLGGTAAHALRIGRCHADDLVDRAGRIAEGALTLFARSRSARRMKMLIHEFGANWVAPVCGGGPTDSDEAFSVRLPDSITGPCDFGGLPVFGLTAPFGRLDSGMLQAAAQLAASTPRGEIRLTPWRTLLVPAATPSKAETTMLRDAGFIVAARDPRLGVAACTGREGCASGTTSTHTDAGALADLAARLGDTSLHVSGCQKGCAKASVSAVTLVGHDGRYDLVRDGRASDFPIRRGLDLPGVRAAIEAILENA